MKTASERLADLLIRRHIFVQRYANGRVQAMLAALDKLRPNMRAAFTAALDETKAKPPFIGPAQMRVLLEGTSGALRTELRRQFKGLETELEGFAEVETDYYGNALNDVVSYGLANPTTSPVVFVSGAQAAAAAFSVPFQGATIAQWPDALADWWKRKAEGVVRAAWLQGTDTAAIVRQVMEATNGVTRNSVASVVDTAVKHYAAGARELTAQANADIIDRRWWLSTLDTHTSPMCQLRDRLFYPRDVKPETVGCRDYALKDPVPGATYGAGPGRLHYRCRSTETWRIKGVDEWKGTRPALKAGAEGYFTEHVANSTRYPDWVARQPRHVQEDIFGPVRAEQIARGVKVPELYSDDGSRLLSLAELKARNIWREIE